VQKQETTAAKANVNATTTTPAVGDEAMVGLDSRSPGRFKHATAVAADSH